MYSLSVPRRSREIPHRRNSWLPRGASVDRATYSRVVDRRRYTGGEGCNLIRWLFT
jgi:hypothetical protein